MDAFLLAALSGAAHCPGSGLAAGSWPRPARASRPSSGLYEARAAGSVQVWWRPSSRTASRASLYASLAGVAFRSPAGTSQSGVSAWGSAVAPRSRTASQSMKKQAGRGAVVKRRFLGDRSPTVTPMAWNRSSVSARSARSRNLSRSLTTSPIPAT
ncbi:hypothetical protein HX747_11925 [Streptomyces sp. L06]|nr:hypothetical protein [Streptomyces sp. L06]